MPAKRITMRNIREVLRLKLSANLTLRQIRDSTKISLGAIQKLLVRATELGLAWPLPEDLDDQRLAHLFYPGADSRPSGQYQVPDWPALHQELTRKGITKQLLWEEYCQQYPTRCYSYSQFCDLYSQWAERQKRSMRQLHKAGEKCFVDYAGQTVPLINAATGEIRNAQIFVAVMGASNYTYVEGTLSQSLPDWLSSHVRLLEYLGAVPAIIVPDNLRSGVSRACRYDPDVNPAYQQLATHYRVAVVPARPYKPRDKAKVEVGVQVVERWILARLRRHSFFSLAELNQCIRNLVDELNQKPFKQLPGNRRDAFERLDRPAMRALPVHPYRYVDIKPVKVNIDYHVQYQQHFYSAPHQYVGETLELHASDTLVTLFFGGRQVAAHARRQQPGMTTETTHMPIKHGKHLQWTPERLRRWAEDIGQDTLTWVSAQLDAREHPEQAYRVCLGLLNLSREFTPERLDAACRIANREGLRRLKQVRSILTSNRDRLPETPVVAVDLPQEHANIRGPQHFH